MNEIWLRDFRCFHERQTARLAPLTLLVGENSTGKTSFLAMVRALVYLAYGSLIPDFKEPPHDLGSFDEIAHHRGAKGSRAESFSAGFSSPAVKDDQEPWRFDAEFRREGTAPLPERRRYTLGNAWIADALRNDSTALQVVAGTSRGTWRAPLLSPFHASDPDGRWLFSNLLVRAALSTAHDVDDLIGDPTVTIGGIAEVAFAPDIGHEVVIQPIPLFLPRFCPCRPDLDFLLLPDLSFLTVVLEFIGIMLTGQQQGTGGPIEEKMIRHGKRSA